MLDLQWLRSRKSGQLFLKDRIVTLLSWVVATSVLAIGLKPAEAAEKLYPNYGPLSFSISVEALDTFAKDGTKDSALASLLGYVSDEQQEKLRGQLNINYQFEHFAIAQFFYSSLGEQVLQYLGESVRTEGGQHGFYAIRSALILAAAEPEGLSLVSFMRNFPTNIQLDVGQILQQVRAIQDVLKQRDTFVAELEERFLATQASAKSVNFSELPDVQATGGFNYSQNTKVLYDSQRQRELFLNYFIPKISEGSQAPVIVISNGLGSEIDRYAYLAKHLASYGFAVFIPNHPDSDHARQQAFLQGLDPEMFDATAYIDRPLDISFILDELETINHAEFEGQLDLNQVGVFGNSFGGVTALSLVGADIDFDWLKERCDSQRALVNISLLIQCEALQLSREDYAFKDERIKAVNVLFPGTRSLFSESSLSQIDAPILWGSVSDDIFSPLLIEQVPVFEVLTTPNKYLAILSGIEHLNLNFFAIRNLSSIDDLYTEEVAIQEPEIVQTYLRALSLAFFQTHLANKPEYEVILSAPYAYAITEAPYNLNLIRSLSDTLPDWQQNVAQDP